jgi:RHS repeat-associated protein
VNSLKPVRYFGYSYDGLGRMKRSDYQHNTNATPLNNLEEIDFENLTITNVDSLDGFFDYDKNGRITGQRSGGVSSADSAKYTYADSSYRLNKVVGKVISSPARNMNRTDNFQYDSRGAMVADSSKDLKVGYDWRMMPLKFHIDHAAGADTAEYEFYDAGGMRVSRIMTTTASGSEKRFSAQHYLIGKEWREAFNGSEVLSDSNELISLASGGTIGRIRSNGAYEYYVKNHIGSTVRVVNENGSFLSDTGSAYDYMAYGNLKTLKGNTESVTETFTGKEYEDETRLVYFGARYLDPELGIWLTTDPSREYFNPYSYVGGKVILFVDPLGRRSFLRRMTHRAANAGRDAVDVVVDYKEEIALGALIVGGVALGGAPALIAAGLGAGLSTSVAALSGTTSISGLTRAALMGGATGALTAGIGSFGSGLATNMAYSALGNAISYSATTGIMGGDVTAGGMVSALATGAAGGLIPGYSAQSFGGGAANYIGNAASEIAYGAAKGLLVGGATGGLGALIDGGELPPLLRCVS